MFSNRFRYLRTKITAGMSTIPFNISPDGHFYLAAARGESVPSPYHMRWLLPRLLGPVPARWQWLTWISLACTPVAAAAYFWAMGLRGAVLLFATILLSSLPAIRIPWTFPILIDAPSFAGALVVAAATLTCPWYVTLPLALILGATRESSPVFAALWAWHPLPLIGVAASGWYLQSASSDIAWLREPRKTAWQLRRAIGFDSWLYLRPFGAILAGLGAPSLQILVTAAVVTAQLFWAQDTLRLLMWCAPVLTFQAAQLIPLHWSICAILITILHNESRV